MMTQRHPKPTITEEMQAKLDEMDVKIAEMNSIRSSINGALAEVQAAKLTAFNGALTKSGDGTAFNAGDIYMNVLTGEIFEK